MAEPASTFWQVSMLAFKTEQPNADMMSKLNPGIAVYDATHIDEIGMVAFIQKTGVSLIHSHMVSLDYYFFWQHDSHLTIPYLVTLHGLYEACAVDTKTLSRFAERVTHWVYTADRNLESLRPSQSPTTNSRNWAMACRSITGRFRSPARNWGSAPRPWSLPWLHAVSNARDGAPRFPRSAVCAKGSRAARQAS